MFGKGTVVVIVSLVVLAGIRWYREWRHGEKNSAVLVSGPELSRRDLLLAILADLAKRQDDSFCTFGPTRDEEVWFQVTGATDSLGCGNLSWPRTHEFPASLAQLGIAVPPNLEVTHDDSHEGRRVITFTCDDLTVEQWADLIQAVFRQVHRLSPDAPIKGWVTRS